MSSNNRSRSNKQLMMLVNIALLVALEVVLSRVLAPVKTWNMKFSFGFIPVIMAAFLYGPMASAMTAGLSDLIGAILFPFGPFFPGYTLTAFCVGYVYGHFLKKNKSMKNIICAVLINQFGFSLLVNTFWISLTSGSPYIAQIVTRVPQSVIMSGIIIAVTVVLTKQVLPRVILSMNRT